MRAMGMPSSLEILSASSMAMIEWCGSERIESYRADVSACSHSIESAASSTSLCDLGTLYSITSPLSVVTLTTSMALPAL
jgi:hypothetical protein